MMKVMMAIMAVMEGNGRENEEGGKAIERKSGVWWEERGGFDDNHQHSNALTERSSNVFVCLSAFAHLKEPFPLSEALQKEYTDENTRALTQTTAPIGRCKRRTDTRRSTLTVCTRHTHAQIRWHASSECHEAKSMFVHTHRWWIHLNVSQCSISQQFHTSSQSQQLRLFSLSIYVYVHIYLSSCHFNLFWLVNDLRGSGIDRKLDMR